MVGRDGDTLSINARRKRIYSLIASGFTQASMAKELGVSEQTILRDVKAMADDFKQERIESADRAILDYVTRAEKRLEQIYSEIAFERKKEVPDRKRIDRLFELLHKMDKEMSEMLQSFGIAPKRKEEIELTKVDNPFEGLMKRYASVDGKRSTDKPG